MSGLPSLIAIDGPVASGKTTVGKAVAGRLGYLFVDTGLMYRAVTLAALEEGVPIDDAAALGVLVGRLRLSVEASGAPGNERVFADGADVTDALRTPAVNGAVSAVSQVPEVRHALVALQRDMARAGGVVMVGRDIGTNVLPGAAKVYLEASVEERVRRRHAELASQGSVTTTESVRQNVSLRDRLDSEREANPLRAADDAVVVQTDGLSVDEVVVQIIGLLEGAA